MRGLILLLVVTMLLFAGSAFAVDEAEIAAAVQNGNVDEIMETLLETGESEAVVATQMMAFGADSETVTQWFGRRHHHHHHHDGNDDCHGVSEHCCFRH